MLAEEATTGDACQVVGGRELAVLGKRDTQHGLEFGDSPRGGEACIQLALRGAPRDALIRAGRESGGPLAGLIELGDINDERGALGRTCTQAPDQLRAVGYNDRTIFAGAAVQRLVLIGHRLALEHAGADALLELSAQRRILTYQQRFRWRHHTQHDRDTGRRFFVSVRQPLRAPLQDALYDRGLPAGWHGSLARCCSSAEAQITDPRRKMRGPGTLMRSS